MMSRFIALVCAAVCAASPLLAAAQQGVSSAEIKIGMVNAQSGPASSLGTGMLEGARAVFREVNARGGVHGRRINLVLADDNYEPDATMDETLRMVQQQDVFALFGFVGSATTAAALPILRELEVPLVASVSGAMALRQPVSPEMFNLRASYEDETEVLVARLVAGGAQKIAVFHQYDSFGSAVLSGVEKALKKRGLQVALSGSFQRNTQDIHSALANILEAAPDAVVMAGPYAPLAAFINAARGAGLKSTLATVSFVATYSLLPLVGANGEGLLISQVVPPPADDSLAITRECRAVVREQSHVELNFLNFEGCLSAKVLVLALDLAGKSLTRGRLREALESMHDIDLGGWRVTLSPIDHQGSRQVYLTQLRAGQVVAVQGSGSAPVAAR